MEVRPGRPETRRRFYPKPQGGRPQAGKQSDTHMKNRVPPWEQSHPGEIYD